MITDLSAELANALAPDGWGVGTTSPPGGPQVVTRPVGHDLLVFVRVVSLPEVRLGLPRLLPSRARRPSTISGSVGLGLAPAMDLAPVLGQPVDLGAVVDFAPFPPGSTVTSVAAAARAAHTLATQRFSDASAFLELLRARGAAVKTGPALSLVLALAATGHTDEARYRLGDLEPERDDERRRLARLLRQLDRWEAAGRPAPPPCAVTLARLPATRFAQPPTTDLLELATRQRRVQAEARRELAGLEHGELAARLIVAYTAEGIPVAPATALAEASQLTAGRTQRWRGLRTAAGDARSAFSQLRHGEPAPAWRRRPPTAEHHARGGGGHVLVELDPAGRDHLRRGLDGAGAALTDVWFRPEAGSDRVQACVGHTAVGVLDTHTAARFAPDIAAAAELYDEQAFVNGLTFTVGDDTVRLQIPLPPAP